MAPRFFKKALLWLGVPIATLALIYFASWYFLPLQMSELSNRIELWRGGVQKVSSGKLQGYLKDTCTGSPNPKNCTCVALVHGLADNAMTWKKLLLWPDAGWLQPVKLYAFDLPGSGDSVPPADPSDYRVRKQAATLREAMAPLCSQWVVVGNSLGGWIASWVALDWREGVSRLILLGSIGLKSGAQDGANKALFTEPTVESLKDFQKRAYYQGSPLPEHVWVAAVQRMKESNARQIVAAQTPEDYLDDRLPSMRRPTLLLWGAADQVSPPSNAQVMKSLIPGSILQEVPECGHLPQKECPLAVIKAIHNMIEYGGV